MNDDGSWNVYDWELSVLELVDRPFDKLYSWCQMGFNLDGTIQKHTDTLVVKGYYYINLM